MNITLINGRELGPELVGAWRALQHANPALGSPYFCPEFTAAVAQVRPDVEVAIVEDAGGIVAFFPFQRQGRVGSPVGGILSDYQGVVCRPGYSLNPRRLVRACGLKAWDFDHLLAAQRFLAPFHRDLDISPVINLANGFEAYALECNAVRAEQRKFRRIERELGPLRFVVHSPDPAHLQQTIQWKSKQYEATGVVDVFALGWPYRMVENIHATQTDGCAGMLSLLFAGDRLISGHFGMRSRDEWHWWFPSYDAEFARYSPGLVLLLKMAEHAPAIGLRTIDLGKGMSPYKERLMNASVPLATGSVETFSWLRCRRSAARCARGLLARTGMAKPARAALRWLRARG